MTGIRKDIRLQRTVLLVGIGLMAIKFAAWQWTSSNTILTDALESFVNVFAGAFSLYSLWMTSKPRDPNHPYGHGKVEFFSGSLEGVLIGIAGISILIKSIYNFFEPHEVRDIDIGLIVVFFAGAVNYGMGHILVKRGRINRSAALLSDGEHLKSDGITSAALIIGLIAIWITGWGHMDNAVAIAFGFYLLYTGVRVTRKSVAGLMDEWEPDMLDAILEVLNEKRSDSWIDMHNFRLIRFGRKLHIDCHVTMPWYYKLEESHGEVQKIEHVIRTEVNEDAEFFIHVDPCTPVSCPICPLLECPVRKTEFAGRIPWTRINAYENRRHDLKS